MDRTKKYILQCEKAVEIQKGWQPNILDIFYYANGISHVTTEDFCKCVKHKGVYFKRQKTWLPRQDDMQEMLPWGLNSLIHGMFWFVNKKICNMIIEREDLPDYRSMEQLWLAFVMKEKYGKVWNGKEWIKKEK